MTDQQSRQCVLTFVDAFYAGDVARATSCCDDELDSITHAPVEIFPHLGHKHGKAWVKEAIQIQEKRYSSRRYTIDYIAVDGPRVATILQVNLQKRNDQRIVQFSTAVFYTVKAGLIIEHRSFLDSFDLIQQLLGHDLTDAFATSVNAAMQR
ncbi:nuclear transport factor 2 family protein [Bradyrhizobium sp. G127]|uniref:nuclear transport factor 2 family protein n=1 Tax=Bradyrhizobium sp. G127 TaxID=2904800 RepID=UPI001F3AE3F7|nr:nuclear transport factor 2 family protein [Bradyrhizobium sp. G127]MCF2522255.1 nuclear transport factor 2 family protein [Bradyrhizobium sp. G127]